MRDVDHTNLNPKKKNLTFFGDGGALQKGEINGGAGGGLHNMQSTRTPKPPVYTFKKQWHEYLKQRLTLSFPATF